MSLPDIDCMNYLINIARGFNAEDDLRIPQHEVTHAVVWGMGVTVCSYDRQNHGHYVKWLRRNK